MLSISVILILFSIVAWLFAFANPQFSIKAKFALILVAMLSFASGFVLLIQQAMKELSAITF